MKHAVILLLVCLLTTALPFTGYSQTTTIKKQGNTIVYQDKFGNKTGSSTKSGNTTTFRDSHDKVTATAINSGNTTTIRNSSGKRIATVTKPKK
jgi:hypothetical protein